MTHWVLTVKTTNMFLRIKVHWIWQTLEIPSNQIHSFCFVLFFLCLEPFGNKLHFKLVVCSCRCYWMSMAASVVSHEASGLGRNTLLDWTLLLFDQSFWEMVTNQCCNRKQFSTNHLLVYCIHLCSISVDLIE